MTYVVSFSVQFMKYCYSISCFLTFRFVLLADLALEEQSYTGDTDNNWIQERPFGGFKYSWACSAGNYEALVSRMLRIARLNRTNTPSTPTHKHVEMLFSLKHV